MTDPALILRFRESLRACTACDLRSNATAPVPWRGDLNPDIAVLGMAPGRTEDREGQPFVGPAGARMEYLLRNAGIEPKKVAFTNAAQCLPPNDKVYQHHLLACRKWMRGQLAIINPRYLIVAGTDALTAIREGKDWPKIAALHGKPLFWPNPPVPARPKLWVTYHPAAALRQGKYQKAIEEDLAAFQQWRADGEPWVEVCFVCGGLPHRFDEWGICYCQKHAERQGLLFPEDVGRTLDTAAPVI